jgi:hypothetical protein
MTGKDTMPQRMIRRLDDRAWGGPADLAPTHDVEALVESGHLLWFPQMPFELLPEERRLLDPTLGDAKAKNISLRAGTDELRGAQASAQDQAALKAMVARFRDQAQVLVERLFPHYRGHLSPGNASFRPYAVQGRQSSWRKDDSRLHVDAFPSNPMRGQRLLRVFTNINPNGEPRVWRVGEGFEQFAQRHVAQIPRPLPGSASVLHWLHVTKRPRSEYDHLMLHLHDRAKADMAWQQSAPQHTQPFPPGSTWVVYSDQVLHAVMSGQFMMEQTFMLQPQDLLTPQTSPLQVLERLTGRPLLAR